MFLRAKEGQPCWCPQLILRELNSILPADLSLTGLQISTNQRATRKRIWSSIHSRAFREGKLHVVLTNKVILCLTD